MKRRTLFSLSLVGKCSFEILLSDDYSYPLCS
jgi:hypothetical protein